MNIAELLEKALEECNWDLVSDVYEMMTGKKIDPPSVDDGFDVLCNITDRLESLESSLVNALGLVKTEKNKRPRKKSTPKTKRKETKENFDSQDFSITESQRVNKPSRNISAEGKVNKFEDMQDVIAEAGRENGYDKIDDNVKPASRKRKSYSTKDVSCVECSKTFSVHPMFVRSNYTCDRCLSKRG